jgi:hypothetical protein
MQSERSRPLFEETAPNEDEMLKPMPSTFEALGKCLFPASESPAGKETKHTSFQENKLIATINEEDSEAEDQSFSENSTGNRSEDVPEIVNVENTTVNRNDFVFSRFICRTFLKKSYRQASAVFGTMVAFFIIAIRIELILLDTCSMDGKFVFRIYHFCKF